MAKVPLSVRVSPQTLEKLDQTAAILGTTRGKLASEAIEEVYGGSLTPLEFAQMLLDQNAEKVLGEYFDGLKRDVLDETAKAVSEVGA